MLMHQKCQLLHFKRLFVCTYSIFRIFEPFRDELFLLHGKFRSRFWLILPFWVPYRQRLTTFNGKVDEVEE